MVCLDFHFPPFHLAFGPRRAFHVVSFGAFSQNPHRSVGRREREKWLVDRAKKQMAFCENNARFHRAARGFSGRVSIVGNVRGHDFARFDRADFRGAAGVCVFQHLASSNDLRQFFQFRSKIKLHDPRD